MQRKSNAMHLKSPFRGKGIGSFLRDALIAQAQEIGYPVLRLDSARFMRSAHRLNNSAGFNMIEPYAESEIPLEMRQHWVLLEKQLR
jgi:GNAT superfamily N-acetyltransferase